MNDLNLQFNTFEPDMNLSVDVCGSIYATPEENESESSLPENFWFHNYSDFSLVDNRTESVHQKGDWFSQTIMSNDMKQIIKKAYTMAMNGTSLLKIEQTIKLSFSENDIQSNPELKKAQFTLPLVGRVFCACKPYISPEDSKKIISYRNGMKPVLILGSSICNQCQYRNELAGKKKLCSKLGMEIWSGGFSDRPPKSVIDHLVLNNKIQDDKSIGSWSDVRRAILKTPVKELTRVYAHNVPTKKALPGALYRKSILALNRVAHEKSETAEKEAFDTFRRQTAYPLMVTMQEAILKSRQRDLPVTDRIRKTLLPPGDRERSEQIICSLSDDPLLWSSLRMYLPAYQKCDDIKRFLYRNQICVPYGIQRPECTSCIGNCNSFCKSLECTLVSFKEHIPMESIHQSIETIGLANRIDWNRIKYCKKLEAQQYLSGIIKIREMINAGMKSPIYNGPGLQDSTALDGDQLSQTDVESWVGRKLKENVSIVQIKATLEKVKGLRNVDDLLQQAILLHRITPTNSNDLCLADYQLHSSIVLTRTDRCMYCQEASTIGCDKFNKSFSAGVSSVPEGYNETISYFKDSHLAVDIKPKKSRSQIEVTIDNPGDDMSVDIKTDRSLDDLSIWQEAAGNEMEVNVDMPIEFESGLDCTVDNCSEGMVLGDDLI